MYFCAPFVSFSKNEENEIHSYLHQQWWTYSSEDELVKILNILALLLNDYTDKVFSVLENAIESSELSKSLVGVRDNIRLNIQNVIDYCVLNY